MCSIYLSWDVWRNSCGPLLSLITRDSQALRSPGIPMNMCSMTRRRDKDTFLRVPQLDSHIVDNPSKIALNVCARPVRASSRTSARNIHFHRSNNWFCQSSMSARTIASHWQPSSHVWHFIPPLRQISRVPESVVSRASSPLYSPSRLETMMQLTSSQWSNQLRLLWVMPLSQPAWALPLDKLAPGTYNRATSRVPKARKVLFCSPITSRSPFHQAPLQRSPPIRAGLPSTSRNNHAPFTNTAHLPLLGQHIDVQPISLTQLADLSKSASARCLSAPSPRTHLRNPSLTSSAISSVQPSLLTKCTSLTAEKYPAAPITSASWPSKAMGMFPEPAISTRKTEPWLRMTSRCLLSTPLLRTSWRLLATSFRTSWARPLTWWNRAWTLSSLVHLPLSPHGILREFPCVPVLTCRPVPVPLGGQAPPDLRCHGATARAQIQARIDVEPNAVPLRRENWRMLHSWHRIFA